MAVSLFGIGAVDCEAGTMLRIVHEVDRGIPKIVDGDIVNDNLNAVRVEGGVNITQIIIQSHAEVDAAATAAGDIYSQCISFKLALLKNIFDSLTCGGGQGENLCFDLLEHIFLLWDTSNFAKYYQV